jgi:hypothetical protein
MMHKNITSIGIRQAIHGTFSWLYYEGAQGYLPVVMTE